ncbi:MAG: SBBP repeat-containing protein, partial [Ardenticatenaceae bacterium]
SLLYSTYLGGSSNDSGGGIAVDRAGNMVVVGGTSSADFPTANPWQSTLGGNSDLFVAKLAAPGDTLIYSTYLGGSSHDSDNGIGLDIFGNAYIVGTTASTDFPTVEPLLPPRGGSDAIVAKLSSSGRALLYSTYLGGSDLDEGYGIAVARTGTVHLTGSTESDDLPVLNPVQATYGGGLDAFVIRFAAAPLWQHHLPLVAR